MRSIDERDTDASSNLVSCSISSKPLHAVRRGGFDGFEAAAPWVNQAGNPGDSVG